MTSHCCVYDVIAISLKQTWHLSGNSLENHNNIKDNKKVGYFINLS